MICMMRSASLRYSRSATNDEAGEKSKMKYYTVFLGFSVLERDAGVWCGGFPEGGRGLENSEETYVRQTTKTSWSNDCYLLGVDSSSGYDMSRRRLIYERQVSTAVERWSNRRWLGL